MVAGQCDQQLGCIRFRAIGPISADAVVHIEFCGDSLQFRLVHVTMPPQRCLIAIAADKHINIGGIPRSYRLLRILRHQFGVVDWVKRRNTGA